MRIESFAGFALILFVLVVGFSPALAQEETGAVQGTVVLDGGPVAGAQVVLTCTARSDFQSEAVSDDAGGFELTGVPMGDFFVQVYNADELVAEGQGTLNADGDTVTVEITPVS